MADNHRQRCEELLAQGAYESAFEIAEMMCEEARLLPDEKGLKAWMGLLAEAGAAGGDPYFQCLLGRKPALPWGDNLGKWSRASALMGAAAGGHLELVSELLAAGADLELADKRDPSKMVQGLTPLMSAASGNHVDIIRLLAERGAKLDACDGWGRTALHHAVLNQHMESTQTLLALGVDPLSHDRSGQAPLHIAAERGPVPLVRLLVARCEVDFRTAKGATPLMGAARHGNLEVMQVLLELGAELEARDKTGSGPFDYYTQTYKYRNCIADDGSTDLEYEAYEREYSLEKARQIQARAFLEKVREEWASR
jgi:hypothetical protein